MDKRTRENSDHAGRKRGGIEEAGMKKPAGLDRRAGRIGASKRCGRAGSGRAAASFRFRFRLMYGLFHGLNNERVEAHAALDGGGMV